MDLLKTVSITTHYYGKLDVLGKVTLQGSVYFSRTKQEVSQKHESANKWIKVCPVEEEVNNHFEPLETLCLG